MKSETYQVILKQTGSLFILLGVIVAIPALVSIMYAEWYSAAGFLLSGLITSGIGLMLYRAYDHSEEVHYNHAIIVAAFGWLAITFMGGLPFFIIS